MKKQWIKLEETRKWLESNAPEDASILIMGRADEANKKEEYEKQNFTRRVELKTFIEGDDDGISVMLAKKMVAIPILHQIFIDALSRMNVNIDLDAFDKWREKNKYDGEKYEILKFDEESILPYEGEPEDYIKVIQEFCIWMNEKHSRNLTLLVFADDEINSVITSFAM